MCWFSKYSRLWHTHSRELAVLSVVSNEVTNEALHWSYRCKTIVNFLRSVIKLHCYLELVKRFKTQEIVLDRNKWTRGTMSSITEVKIFVLRVIVKKKNNRAVILQKTAYTHTHTHTHTHPSFRNCPWLFCTILSKLNHCNKDHMAPKA